MQTDIIRVMRVIVYEGQREWVERTISKSIHGVRDCGKMGKIHASTIGLFPEILRTEEAEKVFIEELFGEKEGV